MKELFSHNPNSALGAATNETVMVGGEVCTLTRKLDDRQRLEAIRLDGRLQSAFAYDNEGRLAVVSNSVFSAAYAFSNRGLDVGYTLTLTNGVSLNRALARNGYRHELIRRVDNTVSTGYTNTLVYAYDDAGRRTARNADTFGYNPRSEVTNATLNAIDYTYAYDDIGNHTASSANSVSTIYDANALNQYSEISVPSVPSVDNLSYDRDGNLLTNDVWSYTYDAENRMTSAYSNSLCVVSNAYDHASRRVVKVTPTAMHTFMYDGWNLIQETVQNQQSTITNHYVWGRDLSGSLQGAGGVGGLLAVLQNGSWYFPFFDVNGNITVYVDEQGSVVASYAYDPFGATIAQSGSMADAFAHRFSTKYFDAETGMYYYGYRFYSPVLHRWLNRDPIEEEGGENLYGFCGNDGVNRCDILGMEWHVKREGKPYAMAYSDNEGDTFDGLGILVGLDTEDYQKWAHTTDLSPITCKKYEIPNTVYLHTGKRNYGIFRFLDSKLLSDQRSVYTKLEKQYKWEAARATSQRNT